MRETAIENYSYKIVAHNININLNRSVILTVLGENVRVVLNVSNLSFSGIGIDYRSHIIDIAKF